MLVASKETSNARRAAARRAFSLIELIAVLTIVGLLSSMAYMRFGDAAFHTTSAEGFVRTLMLDLRQARARTISTGDNHYLLLVRTGGDVTAYTLYRSGGVADIVVDRMVDVPDGATVTTATDRWEFDFDGSLDAGVGTGSIVVTGDCYTWTITIYKATGCVTCSKVAL